LNFVSISYDDINRLSSSEYSWNSKLLGEDLGYSPYSYDINSAKVSNVIYPSLDPAIFEIRFPNTDIQGRVVSL